EHVERLAAKFELQFFLDCENLVQRKIGLEEARPCEDVAPRAVLADARSAEPRLFIIAQVRNRRASSDHVAHGTRVAREPGVVGQVTENHAAERSHSERKTGTPVYASLCGPAADQSPTQAAPQPRLSRSAGQLINTAGGT